MAVLNLKLIKKAIDISGISIRPMLISGLYEGMKKHAKVLRKKNITITMINLLEEIKEPKSKPFIDQCSRVNITMKDFEEAAVKVIETLDVVKTEEVKRNIGRNELCPCGSGKKYKKCCGK